ncbi:MAG: ferrous iron transport protein B [Clostridiales bacterium]|nr:ferrous iron transport protein B [Clostridiales bacterium]
MKNAAIGNTILENSKYKKSAAAENANESPVINIALAGNPNSGKTTLFNALTGERRYVGNWAGVTVERRSGIPKGFEGVAITDLPGLYSLYTYTPEEEISRDFIFSPECEVVINVADGVNIERNLYLTLQLIETGKPVVLAVNMCDVLEKRGIVLDYERLSDELCIPVIPVSASKGTGLKRLLKAAVGMSEKGAEREKNSNLNTEKNGEKTVEILIPNGEKRGKKTEKQPRYYTAVFEEIIGRAERIFEERNFDFPRYRAVKFFDTGDTGGAELSDLKRKAEYYEKKTEREIGIAEELSDLKRKAEYYEKKTGRPIDTAAADQKYLFIKGLLSRAGKKDETAKQNGAQQKIDAVLTHKIFAVPIFFLIMFAVFFLAFGPPGQSMKSAFGYLYDKFIVGFGGASLQKIGVSPWLYGLLCDGILKGVGSVLSFLPEIALLFTALSILEDSGYMARAAFVFDRIFYRFGLSGKSFIPMLMGFGCNVPAITAARTLEDSKQRLLTMSVIPFISCGARLPVYAVFAAAFFPKSVPAVIFSLYVLGIAVAAVSALILKKAVKGGGGGFIMELPEYRAPSIKNLSVNTLERLKDFVLRAGTLIALSCAAVWFLQNFTPELRPAADAEDSLLAYVGRNFAFIFRPLGFGDWRAATALLTGLTAKEAVLGTLEILFGLSGNPAALSAVFSPASAYSFMVFTLLYTPCIAALAALKKEINSFKYFAAVTVYQLSAAWLTAFAAYRIFLAVS